MRLTQAEIKMMAAERKYNKTANKISLPPNCYMIIIIIPVVVDVCFIFVAVIVVVVRNVYQMRRKRVIECVYQTHFPW